MGDPTGRPLFSIVPYLVVRDNAPHHSYFNSGLVPNKQALVTVNRVAKVSNTNG